MECNRDEAIRAKTIAERKLTDKDFAGAKKFALKAQNLYPALEGLSQLLTTLDVHNAAENKVSGEVDWYGVLGVNPVADDETIRKQYRKLALTLHPDKNKSVGADGAFKLLSEAWSLLSDKAKRLAYNQRRSSKGFQQKVATHTGRPSAASSANGVHNFTNKACSKPKTQKNTATTPSFQRTDTFWTICNQCKMHYEYLKIYLDNTLLCPNCKKPFLAKEMAPPVNYSKSADTYFGLRHQNLSNHAPRNNLGRNSTATQNVGAGGSVGPNANYSNFNRGGFSNVAGAGYTEPSISAKAANVVQQANDRLKRVREDSQGAAGLEGIHASVLKGDTPLKKRRVLDNDSYYSGGKLPFQMAMGNAGTGLQSVSGLHGFSGISSRPNSTRELTQLELRNMLMGKAQMEIRKKLSELRSEATKVAELGRQKVDKRMEQKQKNTVKGGTNMNGNGDLSSAMRADQTGKSFSSTSDSTQNEGVVPLSMNVPDPDFHDFDQDRTEISFGDNQIWAAYDDDDGMPRFYAFIHKVISRKPFKMRISWLNSKTNNEFGPMEWVGSGFSKTCGEFRVGKYETNKSLNSFSHKVKWTKGTRGILHIVPKKGDIWALYRNWSSDWNGHTLDEVIHKYDMVEVLEDYNEECGVFVTPLIKIAGFRTVFQPHQDPDKAMKIPKEEMFRFSHQVPNYMLTGKEGQNAPKGCLELDPAATPLELLQVITEAKVAAVENGEKVKEEFLSSPGIRDNETADGATMTKGEEMVENDDETNE